MHLHFEIPNTIPAYKVIFVRKLYMRQALQFPFLTLYLLTLLVPGDFSTLVYRGGALFDPPLKMDFLRKKCAILCPGIKFDKILAIF